MPVSSCFRPARFWAGSEEAGASVSVLEALRGRAGAVAVALAAAVEAVAGRLEAAAGAEVDVEADTVDRIVYVLCAASAV